VAVSQVSPYPFYRGMPITHEFHESIKGRQDVAPSYASMEGFIAAKVMVAGLRRAGPRPTREKLIAALESMRRLDLGGIDVTYGPQARIGTEYIDITIINRNGMFVR
jgi:ABC-type branched-subunit amino acid transport system substrate-binding protein